MSHHESFPRESSQPSPRDNRLLAVLPEADYERLLPHLRLASLRVGEVLYQAGDSIHTVYFLTAGLVSLVITSKEGIDVEVGMATREGAVGMSSLMSPDPILDRAIVQMEGSAYRISTRVLQDEFNRSSALRGQLLRHAQAVFMQTAQSALCNRLHSIEERMCRWLLTVSDRMGTDELDVTQEFMASMLGSRRSGVTMAAGILRTAGLIGYSRGHITILDREGLEESACECYGVIREKFERLFQQSSKRD
jgi:CRP-like cAMP-binding protein